MSDELLPLLATLSPADLRSAAREMIRKTEQERHWSRLAVILGRVDRERLFSTFKYASARAYAEHELGLAGDEYATLFGLGRMIQNAGPIPIDVWARLPKTYALQLKRIIGIADRPETWVDAALACTSLEDLRHRIDLQLDREPWTTITIHAPTSTAKLFEASVKYALPDVVVPDEPTTKRKRKRKDPDPELAAGRRHRHLCLELILAHFIATYTPAVHPGQGS